MRSIEGVLAPIATECHRLEPCLWLQPCRQFWDQGASRPPSVVPLGDCSWTVPALKSFKKPTVPGRRLRIQTHPKINTRLTPTAIEVPWRSSFIPAFTLPSQLPGLLAGLRSNAGMWITLFLTSGAIRILKRAGTATSSTGLAWELGLQDTRMPARAPD